MSQNNSYHFKDESAKAISEFRRELFLKSECGSFIQAHCEILDQDKLNEFQMGCLHIGIGGTSSIYLDLSNSNTLAKGHNERNEIYIDDLKIIGSTLLELAQWISTNAMREEENETESPSE